MPAFSASVYDPRVGQDFRATNAYTGDTLSSLADNMFVIDCVGDVDWAARVTWLSELMLMTSTLGFAAVTPWFPGSKPLRTALAADFEMREVTRGLLVGYFSLGVEPITKLFDARARSGGTGGEMLFGGCTEPLDLSEVTTPGAGDPWPLVISQISRIGCCLYLGELQRSTLLARMDCDTAQPLDQLAAALASAAAST